MEQRWLSKFEANPGKWIYVQTKSEASYGTGVKKDIEARWSPPRFYYHLRDGGHVKALKSHAHDMYFLHLDVADFFGCVNRSRVTRCLKAMFSYEQARDIALRSTVIRKGVEKNVFVLPFGFVQSPIIATLCLSKSRLGKFLANANEESAYSVSVYMDDIIVSSNVKSNLQLFLDRIVPISYKSRFFLNAEKQEGPSEKITAFNVELSSGLLSLTPERLEKFKEAYKQADNECVREGIKGYVKSISIKQSFLLV